MHDTSDSVNGTFFSLKECSLFMNVGVQGGGCWQKLIFEEKEHEAIEYHILGSRTHFESRKRDSGTSTFSCPP